MAEITFDESRHPIITLVWPREYSTADVEQFVVHLRALVQRKRSIAVINDILRTRAPTAVERKLITDLVRENTSCFRDHVVGWSDVLRNPFIRGALIAMRWVTPNVVPHEIHGSVMDAEEWCRGRLEKRALGRVNDSIS